MEGSGSAKDENEDEDEGEGVIAHGKDRRTFRGAEPRDTVALCLAGFNIVAFPLFRERSATRDPL